MKAWVNGAVVEQDQASVPATDHGLTVGDGVFESTRVGGGRAFALTRHLQRLARSARGLGLPEPDLDLVRHAVDAVLAANGAATPGAADLRLRITYTGGISPLSSERGSGLPTLVVGVSALPPRAPAAAVVTVPWRRNEHSAVAGLKTTSYAENVVMLAHAHRHGASEVLMANTAGRLCEGTGSNVFLVLGGRLVTPPLSSGCLAGVTRALVLEWVGAEEEDLALEQLAEAEEAFLTSSLRDVLEISCIDGRALTAPGRVTANAGESFAARTAADLDP